MAEQSPSSDAALADFLRGRRVDEDLIAKVQREKVFIHSN